MQKSATQRTGAVGRMLLGARATLAPSDPVARPLTWSTMTASLSSGLFYSVSALFFTRSVGLTATTVGLGLTVAGAAGVIGSFAAGYLADRIGAARVLLAATVGQGLALIAYVLASSTAAFVLTACCAVGLRSVQGTARQAVLARAFTGPGRVEVRARLRVVTNVFIGLGTVLAAGALLIDTAVAYRCTVLLTGVLVLAAGGPLLRLARRECPHSGRDDPALPRRTAGRGAQAAPAEPGRSPLRDRTYLAITALNAVTAMHFGLQTIGVPLWVATHTQAPPVTLSVLLVLNTVLVALFQVRASRGSNDVCTAGRVMARAGALLAVACALYAAAGYGSAVIAIGLLVLAELAHTGAEMWSEAGSWSLAFELADDRNSGAYQGINQAGYSLGVMLAPVVVTATAIDQGTLGWTILGATFLAAGGLTALIAARAARTHPALTAGGSLAPATGAGSGVG